MIIDDFNVARPCLPIGPFEAYAPLLIDTDGELTSPVTSQRLKSVAGQIPQCAERRRGVQNSKPPLGLLIEPLERPDKCSLSKSLGALVPVAQDHRRWILGF